MTVTCYRSERRNVRCYEAPGAAICDPSPFLRLPEGCGVGCPASCNPDSPTRDEVTCTIKSEAAAKTLSEKLQRQLTKDSPVTEELRREVHSLVHGDRGQRQGLLKCLRNRNTLACIHCDRCRALVNNPTIPDPFAGSPDFANEVLGMEGAKLGASLVRSIRQQCLFDRPFAPLQSAYDGPSYYICNRLFVVHNPARGASESVYYPTDNAYSQPDCDPLPHLMELALLGTGRTTGLAADVGASSGNCAFLLLSRGHEVHLFDGQLQIPGTYGREVIEILTLILIFVLILILIPMAAR